jgi:hypothetical protein
MADRATIDSLARQVADLTRSLELVAGTTPLVDLQVAAGYSR